MLALIGFFGALGAAWEAGGQGRGVKATMWVFAAVACIGILVAPLVLDEIRKGTTVRLDATVTVRSSTDFARLYHRQHPLKIGRQTKSEPEMPHFWYCGDTRDPANVT